MHKPLPSFERMLDMAKNDPEALERLRLDMVRDAINSAPEAYQQRLHGLQFQIDGQRLLSKNPMQACLEISRMMHDSLQQLKGFIDGHTGDSQQASSQEPAPAATILRFPSEVL
ncbi:MAG: DUF3135 domain-containing protein [Gammaproteobacteria bacterium]|nr:DUF3135 domain-containing protein [Gammaproteobacteria bacterium]